MNANQYIGLPYSQHNCSELAIRILKEQFEIEVADWIPADWIEIFEAPEPGDVVLLSAFGSPAHIGVVIDEQHFIHTQPDIGAHLSRHTGGFWHRKIVGFYRHLTSC